MEFYTFTQESNTHTNDWRVGIIQDKLVNILKSTDKGDKKVVYGGNIVQYNPAGFNCFIAQIEKAKVVVEKTEKDVFIDYLKKMKKSILKKNVVYDNCISIENIENILQTL